MMLIIMSCMYCTGSEKKNLPLQDHTYIIYIYIYTHDKKTKRKETQAKSPHETKHDHEVSGTYEEFFPRIFIYVKYTRKLSEDD